MKKREILDWRKWFFFLGRRLREILFIAMLTVSLWSLDNYIVRPLPLYGSSRYLLNTFEGLFALSALREVLLLLFWPNKKRLLPWPRK